MTYSVKKGVIYSKKGIPACPRWFADNRLAVQMDETGITRAEYRNPHQKAGNPMVLLKGLHDGLRYYMEVNGITLKAEYTGSAIWPFGIESRWRCGDVSFRHSVYTVKDDIMIRLVTQRHRPEFFRIKQ